MRADCMCRGVVEKPSLNSKYSMCTVQLRNVSRDRELERESETESKRKKKEGRRERDGETWSKTE
jgi:hypothetical protein